jgi:hypothetical protein
MNPTPEIKWVAFTERRSTKGRRSFLAIHKSNWYQSDVYTVWFDKTDGKLVRWPLSVPPTHYAEITAPEPVSLTREEWQRFMTQATPF